MVPCASSFLHTLLSCFQPKVKFFRLRIWKSGTGKTHINRLVRFPHFRPGEGLEGRGDPLLCCGSRPLGTERWRGVMRRTCLLGTHHSCPLQLVIHRVHVLQLYRKLLEPRESLSALSQHVPVYRRASPSPVGRFRLPERLRFACRLTT